MTRVDLGPSYTPENYEADDLSASPIACAVADAWQVLRRNPLMLDAASEAMTDAMNALEAATRNSPLRKVNP